MLCMLFFIAQHVNAQIPVAQFTASDTTICAGGSVTFTNTSTGTIDTTLWTFGGGSKPDTSFTFSPTVEFVTSGKYHVLLKEINSSGSDTTGLTIIVNPLGVITVLPDTAMVCSGQRILLTVAASGTNYSWSPDSSLIYPWGDSVLASPTATITYTVTGIDSLGCRATGTETVTVVPIPNPPTITISVTGDSLVSSSPTGNQWYFDGEPITDSTRQVLVIKGRPKGPYCVTVTYNVCPSQNDCITGINQLSSIKDLLFIYPNPFYNNISIKINSIVTDLNNWNMQLTDVLGRMLYTKPLLSYDNEIDLSGLPSGVYFITMLNKTGRVTEQLVKQ